MEIPVEAYTSDLTDFQFRLLAVICLKSGPEGRLKASAAELGTLTGGVGEKTVRRGLVALEKAAIEIPLHRPLGAVAQDSETPSC